MNVCVLREGHLFQFSIVLGWVPLSRYILKNMRWKVIVKFGIALTFLAFVEGRPYWDSSDNVEGRRFFTSFSNSIRRQGIASLLSNAVSAFASIARNPAAVLVSSGIAVSILKKKSRYTQIDYTVLIMYR